VLKGLKSMDTIGIEDENAMKKFTQNVLFYKFLIRIAIKVFAFTSFLMYSTIVILFFNTIESIIYGVINEILLLICIYIFNISLTSFLYYYISCFYCKLRFQLFNEIISKTSKSFTSKNINKIIREHNSICVNTIKVNQFWKKYYFALTYTVIPIDLMILQMALFGDMILIAVVVAVIILIGFLLSHILLNVMTASVNNNAIKSQKYLFKILTNRKSFPNIHQKIKV
jgi:hypothetical protein